MMHPLEQADIAKEAARRALSEFEARHREVLQERQRLHDAFRDASAKQLKEIGKWWEEKRLTATSP